jgi:ferredoxin-NADP reductase
MADEVAAAFCSARIVSITQATPSIKLLVLHIPDPTFSFQPGQWVDFVPAALPDAMGGFSLCSSPLDALWTQQRHLELAIKNSDQIVVSWIHSTACVGDYCNVRIGGHVTFDSQRHLLTADGALASEPAPALFIAGGVGITPLVAMIRHVHHSAGLSGMSSTLLYSSKCRDELIYRTALAQLSPTTCQFFCTAATDGQAMTDEVEVHNRRIQSSDLAAALGQRTDTTFVYLCGPPSFLDDIAAALKALGVPSAHILFEKWW